MIQRIQSVYLLVVTILLIVCMCTPVGAYIAEDYSVSKFTNLCIVSADGVKDYAPWAMFVILVVAALLSFTTIFMFKKRMLQIRMTICSLCHHYTDHFFRVSDTLLHLPDGNDRVYGARHGGNCNLSSNDCGSDLRMSRFSGGYVSGHPCILSSGGCGIGNG